ncbi:MAG: beta-galactosidase, partial [candidate division Zixibacteria bacterium]|nr:beta-galactosidase [candidate division Zixibacteria bacterium]
HYFRVSKRYWSICFERIRRAGFRVISTVVPWALHEDSHREFDFSGFTDPAKDLVVFIELAREFGFKVILKPGPLVYSELDFGGLPPFLSKYPEILSLDSEGEPTTTHLDNGLGDFNLPSCLHSRMQNFVKHYFNGLTEIIKNYIYPRGPLFLVELDNGVYFGGDPYPWKSDYNQQIVEALYPAFLHERYGEIKHLNSAYKEKAEDFTEVEPPRDFSVCKESPLPKLLDWFRFKEYLLAEQAASLIDLYKSFSCEPLFYQTLAFHKRLQAPLTPILESNGQIFPTVNISWEGSSSAMLQRIRYLRANSEFPWGSAISTGNNTGDRETAKKHFPISADGTKYLLTLAMAAGIKGFNEHMFIESENWYDSPLADDGTIQPAFDVARRLMAAISRVDLGAFTLDTEIGVVANRLNNWISLLEDPAGYRYIKTLAEFTMPEIGRDLDMLKKDFLIPDLDNPESFSNLNHLFVPVTEIMAEEHQHFLLDLARKGVNLILIGLLPKHSPNMGNCQALGNAIHCKTTSLDKIGSVQAGKDRFPSHIFGTINCTEKRSRKLVTYSGKTIGMRINKFKGNIILLTFDASSQGNHAKINFLRSLLSDLKVTFPINTSHPGIRVFVHKANKTGMIYLLNSSPSQVFKRVKTLPTNVVIQVDLRALGFRGSKVRLIDIYTSEEILTTTDELREGLYFSLENLDSRAYHFSMK